MQAKLRRSLFLSTKCELEKKLFIQVVQLLEERDKRGKGWFDAPLPGEPTSDTIICDAMVVMVWYYTMMMLLSMKITT